MSSDNEIVTTNNQSTGGTIMSDVSKNAAEMAVQCVEFLENAGYDRHALWGNVYSHFMSVVRYLKKHGHTEYVPELADAFVDESHERYNNGEISRSTYKDYQRAVRRMNEFYEGGIITRNVERRVSRYQLCDEYERLRSGFLGSRIFHPNTRHDFSWAVRRYLCYFQDHGIYSLTEATVEDARNFVVEAASTMSSGSLHNVLCYLKQFHAYLSGIKEPAPDCTALFSVPVQRETRIRGYVSDEELERILAQTDLSPRHSKRDKAIIMLGATTGLRAVDIVRLKMSDIDWANGEIRIIQQKTGAPIILPLMKPAGEALKDYILNERKPSGAEEVFIRALAPYVALTDSQSVEYLFDRYCRKAGIERTPFDGKGFHGLRRRLGKNLLVSGSPVAVVSQVLGHQAVETAKHYLSLDSGNLKECALDFSGIPVERRGL